MVAYISRFLCSHYLIDNFSFSLLLTTDIHTPITTDDYVLNWKHSNRTISVVNISALKVVFNFCKIHRIVHWILHILLHQFKQLIRYNNSFLCVHMIGCPRPVTYTQNIPSICMSSSDFTLLLASCSLSLPLLLPMESISSMNIVLGA